MVHWIKQKVVAHGLNYCPSALKDSARALHGVEVIHFCSIALGSVMRQKVLYQRIPGLKCLKLVRKRQSKSFGAMLTTLVLIESSIVMRLKSVNAKI
jgi:hypothetical protein